MQTFEFGSPGGIPVVFHFGTPQRGDAGAEFSALAARLNVRLICPTRPWYDDRESEFAFGAVTAPTPRSLSEQGIGGAHAPGGSGGGPFALHLAREGAESIADANLFASMGHPSSFARLVSSPPKVHLLSAFASREHQKWMEACETRGLAPDLAHGAWGDFVVFVDRTESLLKEHIGPVHVFQSAHGEKTAIESVRERLALASDVQWNIDRTFGHLEIAASEGIDQIHEMLSAIASRTAAQALAQPDPLRHAARAAARLQRQPHRPALAAHSPLNPLWRLSNSPLPSPHAQQAWPASGSSLCRSQR